MLSALKASGVEISAKASKAAKTESGKQKRDFVEHRRFESRAPFKTMITKVKSIIIAPAYTMI